MTCPTSMRVDMMATLAGVEKLIDNFTREDTLDVRIHALSIAVVCLLNAERDRLKTKLAEHLADETAVLFPATVEVS